MNRHFAIFLFSFLFLPFFAFASSTDGTIDSTYKYAWGNNIGWVNLGTSGGNIHITDSAITGYAWSQNYGWINMNPASSGIVNDGEGDLSGHAWGQNLGWIDFGNVGISSSGQFSGAAVVENDSSQISFDCANCVVRTDWRPRSARPACNNATDDDSDGKTDYPTDPGCSSLTDSDETDALSGGAPGGAGAGASVPAPIFQTILPDGTITYPESTSELVETIIQPIEEIFSPKPTEQPTEQPEQPAQEIPPTETLPQAAPIPLAPSAVEGAASGGGTTITEITGRITDTFNNIITEAKASFNETVVQFQEASKEVKKAVNTPTGKAVTKTAVAVSVAAAVSQGVTATVLPSVSSLGDLYSVLLRLLSVAGGVRRKTKKWGVVYDSKTKRPIDPAYVTIENEEGKIMEERFTDMEGRFGFLVPAGRYKIKASKTHYSFPSKLGRPQDELYDNLYYGDYLNIADHGVIKVNIPLDPVSFDWNEEIKKKITNFSLKKELVRKSIFSVLFYGGLIASPLVYWAAPSLFNLLIIFFYAIILILRMLGFKEKNYGRIYDKETGKPIPFARIKICLPESNMLIAQAVADITGRYYILVAAKGRYIIRVEGETADGRQVSEEFAKDAYEKVVNFDLRG